MQIDEWNWSNEIIIGSKSSQKVELKGKVFNDQGPPLPFELDIDFSTQELPCTLDDLFTDLPEELEED